MTSTRAPQTPATPAVAAPPAPDAARGTHGTGVTGAPGTIIFWKPSTITRSPSVSPSATTYRVSTRPSILTARTSTVSSGRTTAIWCMPCTFCTARWVTVSAFFFVSRSARIFVFISAAAFSVNVMARISLTCSTGGGLPSSPRSRWICASSDALPPVSVDLTHR